MIHTRGFFLTWSVIWHVWLSRVKFNCRIVHNAFWPYSSSSSLKHLQNITQSNWDIVLYYKVARVFWPYWKLEEKTGMVLQTNIISRGLNRSNSSLAMFKLLMFQVINMGFVKVFPFVISVAIQFTVHLLNLLIWYLKLNMLQSSIFSKPKFPSSGVSL